jgi:hypothetical protein
VEPGWTTGYVDLVLDHAVSMGELVAGVSPDAWDLIEVSGDVVDEADVRQREVVRAVLECCVAKSGREPALAHVDHVIGTALDGAVPAEALSAVVGAAKAALMADKLQPDVGRLLMSPLEAAMDGSARLQMTQRWLTHGHE